MNTEPVRLLWSGGFDSTYRLLQLILLQKRLVQPFYLIDSERASTAFELRARDKIRSLLRDHSPECERLLLPTSFYSIADLRANTILTNCFEEVRSQLGMGNQHLFLALLADQLGGVSYLEICNHHNDPAVTVIEQFWVVAQNSDGSTYYRIPENCSNKAVFELFKYFHFPLGNLNKKELLECAKQYGLLDLLQHTWFCHRPLRVTRIGAIPCGTCNACIYRINTMGTEGFRYLSLLRYRVMRVLRPKRMSIIRKRQGIIQ
ncbi:MAG: 7-cyano-7-deazaguanine synthase [Syntrophobacteraceae bacterium]